jgi:hypothetical protein
VAFVGALDASHDLAAAGLDVARFALQGLNGYRVRLQLHALGYCVIARSSKTTQNNPRALDLVSLLGATGTQPLQLCLVFIAACHLRRHSTHHHTSLLFTSFNVN